MAKNLDKGGKAQAQPPESSTEELLPTDVVESPPPEAKAFRCESCDSRFVPVGNQIVCDACLEKAKAQKSSSRAGYVKCKVVGDGRIVAHGFVDGEVKTGFGPGDVAEFSQADVDSLPGHFELVI